MQWLAVFVSFLLNFLSPLSAPMPPAAPTTPVVSAETSTTPAISTDVDIPVTAEFLQVLFESALNEDAGGGYEQISELAVCKRTLALNRARNQADFEGYQHFPPLPAELQHRDWMDWLAWLQYVECRRRVECRDQSIVH